ncbi:MAG TPA: MarC family protein [Aliiroseovarius sp.]|nr:MarC family protein [Aliiroseovarius sp.]
MELDVLTTAFFTLFVVIDPIGLTPMFIALTKGMTAHERRAVGIRAVVISAGILTLFALFGEAVLGFMGISMPAFRIAGGALLFLTALDMLFERRTERRKGQAHADDDPSVFPLATPLIAGPGAMATMILLTGSANGDWTIIAAMLGVMSAVLLAVLLAFFVGASVEKLLGDTGINVVTRLLGMLLAALAVQFVLDGLTEMMRAL